MKNVIERKRNGLNLFTRRDERKRFPCFVFCSSPVFFFQISLTMAKEMGFEWVFVSVVRFCPKPMMDDDNCDDNQKQR